MRSRLRLVRTPADGPALLYPVELRRERRRSWRDGFTDGFGTALVLALVLVGLLGRCAS